MSDKYDGADLLEFLGDDEPESPWEFFENSEAWGFEFENSEYRIYINKSATREAQMLDAIDWLGHVSNNQRFNVDLITVARAMLVYFERQK